jgi:hypothetical protein
VLDCAASNAPAKGQESREEVVEVYGRVNGEGCEADAGDRAVGKG